MLRMFTLLTPDVWKLLIIASISQDNVDTLIKDLLTAILLSLLFNDVLWIHLYHSIHSILLIDVLCLFSKSFLLLGNFTLVFLSKVLNSRMHLESSDLMCNNIWHECFGTIINRNLVSHRSINALYLA